MKTNRHYKNSENMKELRKRCKRVIDSCTNKEQMKGAYNYIMLAGMGQDSIVKAWFEFKMTILEI